MTIQTINIPSIKLRWSKWYAWHDLKDKEKGLAETIPTEPGVYEVKHRDQNERLTIGMTNNLYERIVKALVRGKTAHSSGRWIRAKEDTTTIVVRWALTDRPKAVEDELHRRYRRKFHGQLPIHTKVT